MQSLTPALAILRENNLVNVVRYAIELTIQYPYVGGWWCCQWLGVGGCEPWYWGGPTWNNGKEVSRLDLTSSTTPGQQIHYGRPHPDSKYNKSVWLAAVSPSFSFEAAEMVLTSKWGRIQPEIQIWHVQVTWRCLAVSELPKDVLKMASDLISVI